MKRVLMATACLMSANAFQEEGGESNSGGTGQKSSELQLSKDSPPSVQPAITEVKAQGGPPMFRVWDTNAKTVPRIHEIIVRQFGDGREPETKSYALLAGGEGTPMLMEDALKFLSDKAFIVKGSDGQRIAPPAKVEGGLGLLSLGEDQVVADYLELTKIALFKRCKLHPNGHVIHANDSQENMIEFLKEQRARERRINPEMSDADLRMNEGELGGNVPPAQLERMFDRSPILQ